jgi:GT2 family glycosyltransferase
VFCTAVIPTIGRPSLRRAVLSVLEQGHAAACSEVIVVNDSGRSLVPDDWQDSPRVRVLSTNRQERSVARNAGVAVARGDYLLFLDDDDLLLPGAMAAFLELARQRPDAVWLYGHYRTVDSKGQLVAEFHPDLEGDVFAALVAGEAIPFQTSCLRADALATAGPFDLALVGVEDRDLGRRLALCGPVAVTTKVVAQIRVGQEGSTTRWETIAELDRRGREKVLDMTGVFRRLCATAGAPYWRGRLARAYTASAVWNVNGRRPLVACRRAAAALWFTVPGIPVRQFWHGLATRAG